MRRYGWLALLTAVVAGLPGCHVVDDLEEAPRKMSASPVAKKAPAEAPAAATSGGQTTPVPAEAPGAGSTAPAGSVLDALGEAASEAAGHAGDTSGLGAGVLGKVTGASRESLKAATAAAELARYRAAAEQERAELQHRRRAYLQAARWHLQFVQLRIQEQDADKAGAQLALVEHSLEGVRSNLGQGVVGDELAFALAQLYDLDLVNKNQDEAVTAAMGHLRRAQRALPAVAGAPKAPSSVKPTDEAKEAAPGKSDAGAMKNANEAVRPDDLPAVAREVSEIIGLFEQKQKRTGRDRLQALVCEMADDQALTILKMAEEARASVGRAVGLRAWRRAGWGLDHLTKLLDELQGIVGTEPAPAAAPSKPLGEPAKPAEGGSGGSTAPKGPAAKGE